MWNMLRQKTFFLRFWLKIFYKWFFWPKNVKKSVFWTQHFAHFRKMRGTVLSSGKNDYCYKDIYVLTLNKKNKNFRQKKCFEKNKVGSNKKNTLKNKVGVFFSGETRFVDIRVESFTQAKYLSIWHFLAAATFLADRWPESLYSHLQQFSFWSKNKKVMSF